MIEGLAPALEEAGEPGIPELELALAEAIPGPASLVGLHNIAPRNIITKSLRSFSVRTVVIKRLAFDRARRNELAFARWLPAVGLEGACPALLGRAAQRQEPFVWHVYEDVGDGALATEPPDRDRLAAVAQLIARLHSRFAEHPLLAEARLLGGDLGISYFAANVADALYGVRTLLSRPRMMTPERRALLERHLARLEHLAASAPMRAEALRAHAGSETFLHGDLWTTNIFAIDGGMRPCLIDWDHAGAGHASYDLSTLLLRFPREHRVQVLQLYCDGIEKGGWRVPGVKELNLLFETAELARCANHLCWVGLMPLLEGDHDWAWERCREVEGWFEGLEPVLPEPEALASGGVRREMADREC